MSIRHFVDSAHGWSQAAPQSPEADSSHGVSYIEPSPTPSESGPAGTGPAEAGSSVAPTLTEWLRFLAGDSTGVFPPRDAKRAEEPLLYIPEYHEPKYAYPVVVWVQSPGRTADADFHRIIEGISERNYVGLAFRPASLTGGAADFDELESDADRLARLVTAARKRTRMHNERVFLVGSGSAGTWALRFGLSRPEWFAGIAAFDAAWPVADRLLSRYRSLRGKRVLLGAGRDSREASVDRGARLLNSAGMVVCQRRYASSTMFDPAKLSDLNRWIMREVYPTPALVED